MCCDCCATDGSAAPSQMPLPLVEGSGQVGKARVAWTVRVCFGPGAASSVGALSASIGADHRRARGRSMITADVRSSAYGAVPRRGRHRLDIPVRIERSGTHSTPCAKRSMDWDAATGVGGVAPVGREHKPNGQNPVGPLRASWRSSAVGGIQARARSSGRRASSQPTLLLLHRGPLATTSPETRSGHHEVFRRTWSRPCSARNSMSESNQCAWRVLVCG